MPDTDYNIHTYIHRKRAQMCQSISPLQLCWRKGNEPGAERREMKRNLGVACWDMWVLHLMNTFDGAVQSHFLLILFSRFLRSFPQPMLQRRRQWYIDIFDPL